VWFSYEIVSVFSKIGRNLRMSQSKITTRTAWCDVDFDQITISDTGIVHADRAFACSSTMCSRFEYRPKRAHEHPEAHTTLIRQASQCSTILELSQGKKNSVRLPECIDHATPHCKPIGVNETHTKLDKNLPSHLAPVVSQP